MAFAPIPSSGGAHAVTATAATINAAGLTVPDAATYAIGTVRTAPIVMSRGSFTPTSTLGTPLGIGDIIILYSREEIDQALFIELTSTDGQIDWDFFIGSP